MRQDRLLFDAKQSVRRKDENGFLHVALTPISKACVNPYLGRELPDAEKYGFEPNQIYYGLRDAKELEKAVKTFENLPLLYNHHTIDADNPAKEHVIGSTGTDAQFDGKYLMNSLAITDGEAIEAIEDGTAKEISCAYRFTLDPTSGEFEDGDSLIKYDFIMRDICGNHVALVKEGRAGHDVKVADSMEELQNKNDSTRAKIYCKILGLMKKKGLSFDAFNEADHPRDKSGKFTSGGGSGKVNTSGNAKGSKQAITGGASKYTPAPAKSFSDEIKQAKAEMNKAEKAAQHPKSEKEATKLNEKYNNALKKYKQLKEKQRKSDNATQNKNMNLIATAERQEKKNATNATKLNKAKEKVDKARKEHDKNPNSETWGNLLVANMQYIDLRDKLKAKKR